MRPQTYVFQDGCQTCRHVFVYTDYDEGPFFYCTFDAPPRPPCMSVGMGEDIWDGTPYSDERYEETYGVWYKWAEEREVNPGAICDSFERGMPDGDV